MVPCAQQPRSCICASAEQHPAKPHSPFCQVQAKSVNKSIRLNHQPSRTFSKQVVEVEGMLPAHDSAYQSQQPDNCVCAFQARHCISCAACSSNPHHANVADRLVSGLMACAAVASLSVVVPTPNAFAGELQPFLSSTGRQLSKHAGMQT